ncbi:MAG: YafY family transcriptional regulator [Frankiaceae bacterium]|nr:YafY family transcriptional regulator [Frankiaceae bacterium]
MKADRLVATLMLLQTRRKVTCAELAAELEISERTARRDLEALSAAGIPVYSQPGRNGGWALLGGARTDLSGLTADEARAMFIVAGPAAAATPELKAALRKLVRALPEPFRESAQTAAQSIVIDPGGWGKSGRAFRPKHLDALQACVAGAEKVRLGYSDRTGKTSTRDVHPLGLVVKGSTWYLVAGTDAGQRTFRVGRITSCELLGEPCDRPPDFDLGEAWERIAANIEEMRSPHHVDAIVDADVVNILRWLFDKQLTVLTAEPDADGRFPVRVGGHHVEQIAGQLAGFGDRVTVTGPAEARAHLAKLGAELVASYAQ